MVQVILAVGLALACARLAVAQVDPFGGVPGEAAPAASTQPVLRGASSAPATAAGGQGPVIGQVQFNDDDINMAFQVVSDVTGWSIFPSAKARGKVSLFARNISAGRLLEQVVNMAGLVHVRQGDVVAVMSYEEYVQYYGVEKRVIKLTQRDAEEVLRALMPFVTPRGRLIADAATRSIIVYEVPANLSLLERVIEEVDQPATQMAIEVIKLVYADVAVLCQELEAIYEPAGERAEARPAAPAAGSQPAVVSAAVVAASGRTVVLCPIARTNHIVLKGYSQDLVQVRALIESLDVAADAMETASYAVMHVAATDLEENLRQSLGLTDSPMPGGSSRAGTPAGRTAPSRSSGSNDAAEGNSRIRVGVLAANNSIIVTAPRVVHEQVKAFLAMCDVPAPEVAGGIQVYKLENANAKEVAEVLQQLVNQENSSQERGRLGLTNANGAPATVGPSQRSAAPPGPAPQPASGGGHAAPAEGGGTQWAERPRVVASEATNSVIVQASIQDHVQLGQLIRQLDRRVNQVLLDVIIVEIRGSDSIDVGLEWETYDGPGSHSGHLVFSAFGLSTLDPATGQREVKVLPGGTAAVIRSDYIPAILHAFENSGKARVRSAPRLLVNDNARGEIQSIAEEPFQQVNASTTVATTSFGGFVQAGTQLQVIPSISENDYLKLQYQIVLNTFRGKSPDPALPPARDTNMISSEATVPDGDSLIVGGLTYKNQRESADKVPLLGEIPLAGHLFRRTIRSDEDVRLYVFVTPRILRDAQFRDLKDISEQQRLESKEPSVMPANGVLELPEGTDGASSG